VSQIINEPQKEFVTALAITTTVALAALYLPVVGLVVSPFIPLPVLFYRSKLGRSKAALVLIAVTVIVASTMRWRSITSPLFFFELGLVGFMLSEMFQMDLSLEKTVILTTAGAVASGMLILGLYSMLSAQSVGEQISGYVSNTLQLALDMYKDMDGADERINVLAQSMEGVLYILLRILPAVAIVSTLFVVWSNLLLARPLLKSRRLHCPEFGSLNQWKAPESLVWVAIASGVLLLTPQKGLKILGVNGLIIMMMIYFFQGIAIVAYYFEKKGFPRLVRILFYSLIAAQQLVFLLVVGVGFFDLWVDFRRLKQRSEKGQ